MKNGIARNRCGPCISKLHPGNGSRCVQIKERVMRDRICAQAGETDAGESGRPCRCG